MSQENKGTKLDRLKYIAWCKSQCPPQGVDFTYKDFLEYAKFQLSVQKNVLLKDPIWDQYGDEELLIEYYANVFEKNEDARKDFESLIGSEADGFADWADKMSSTSQTETKEEEPESEEVEEIDFAPTKLGE